MKISTLIPLLGMMLLCSSCRPGQHEQDRQHELRQSGAAHSLDRWSFQRSYPGGKIPVGKLSLAFDQKRLELMFRENTDHHWEALGPKNIGGRTLSLAFHPNDPNIIFAGSASGGLWKSTSAGQGTEAWERVPTGFPVLAVAAIAIDPNDGEVMYIGTGEVYSQFDNSMPGIVNRLTRGTYGIGILKTTDGGESWTKTLDWSLGDLRGVQDLLINPQNSNTVYAATTEGLIRSNDAGNNWTTINPVALAVNVLLHPLDTNIVFVTHGNLDHDLNYNSGIFRSTNGGNSFVKLSGGLPGQYSGKAMLSISQSDPDIIYASIQEDLLWEGSTTPLGLYKSADGGNTWSNINSENVAKGQGWYSHDVAVKPDDPNTVYYVGIDSWKSLNGGVDFVQKTNFRLLERGQVPVGGPEGPFNYIHADMHRVLYHPADANTLYVASDGGIFVSTDNGESWEGRNGGYQSTQFYANFDNSTTDSLLAIGGMQDNSTAIYTGDDAWTKVLKGDGLSAAINPEDDNIIYGSFQFLNLSRSTDRGQSFSAIALGILESGEPVAFAAPYEIAPSESGILYAGAQHLYKSTNGGDNWDQVNPNAIDGDNVIINMAVSPNDAEVLYISTAPNPFFITQPPALFKTENGGLSLSRMQGLPDRVATDIAFDPLDHDIAYVAFSGFNSSHVYKTEDGGQHWFPIDNGLPDVPTNTVVVDPQFPEAVYVGNDIGVYFSSAGSSNWELFSNDIADAFMVIHLSISPSNRKLRVATHGNGVYQASLVDLAVGTSETTQEPLVLLQQNYPNPVSDQTQIEFSFSQAAIASLKLFDNTGSLIRILKKRGKMSLENSLLLDLGGLPAGMYAYSLEGQIISSGKYFRESRFLIKL